MVRVTGANREQMMAQRRMQEMAQTSLVDYVERSLKLQSIAKQETAIPQRRKQLQQMELAHEERLKRLDEERRRASKRRDLEAETSEAFAATLEARQAEALRKEREILRICSESEELKELETKLKIAYVNKERATQHEERLARETRERLREQAMEASTDRRRAEAELEERTKASTSKEAQGKQQAHLQEQMRERERRAFFAEQEAKRDKELVEDVVRKIRDEDRRDYDLKAKRKEQSRTLLEQYEVQRRREVEEKQRKESETEAEIRKHAERLAEREEAGRRALADKQARDAENFRRIVQETEKLREEDEEMQNLRDLLWEEETEAARRAEDIARDERRRKLKTDMALENERQLEAKRAQASEERQAEMSLVEQMHKKFAEDEAEDRAKANQKHQEKLAYIDAVAKQKAQRLAMYEDAKQHELDELDGDKAADDYRRRVVEAARKRLLEEHATSLSGFLPKGVLKPDELRAFFHDED